LNRRKFSRNFCAYSCTEKIIGIDSFCPTFRLPLAYSHHRSQSGYIYF